MISFAIFSPGFMSDLQKQTVANNFTLLINRCDPVYSHHKPLFSGMGRISLRQYLWNKSSILANIAISHRTVTAKVSDQTGIPEGRSK